MSVVDMVVDHYARTTGVPVPRIHELLREWKFVPYVCHNRIYGAALQSGTEVHFVMKPEYRRVMGQRHAVRRFVAKLRGDRPYLTTRVPLHLVDDLRFLTRLGFEETHRDGRVIYMIMNGLPFERKSHE